VNDEAQTVTIRRTFTEGKGLEQFAGKTVGSIRTVPLSAAAVAAYQSQRRRNPDSPLVFPRPAAATSTSATGATATGTQLSKPPASTRAAQTRFATPSPPGSCSTQTTAGSWPSLWAPAST
jgi:hypothetical protein